MESGWWFVFDHLFVLLGLIIITIRSCPDLRRLRVRGMQEAVSVYFWLVVAIVVSSVALTAAVVCMELCLKHAICNQSIDNEGLGEWTHGDTTSN